MWSFAPQDSCMFIFAVITFSVPLRTFCTFFFFFVNVQFVLQYPALFSYVLVTDLTLATTYFMTQAPAFCLPIMNPSGIVLWFSGNEKAVSCKAVTVEPFTMALNPALTPAPKQTMIHDSKKHLLFLSPVSPTSFSPADVYQFKSRWQRPAHYLIICT